VQAHQPGQFFSLSGYSSMKKRHRGTAFLFFSPQVRRGDIYFPRNYRQTLSCFGKNSRFNNYYDVKTAVKGRGKNLFIFCFSTQHTAVQST